MAEDIKWKIRETPNKEEMVEERKKEEDIKWKINGNPGNLRRGLWKIETNIMNLLN